MSIKECMYCFVCFIEFLDTHNAKISRIFFKSILSSANLPPKNWWLLYLCISQNVKGRFKITIFENLTRQNKLYIQSLNSWLYICVAPEILSFKKFSSFNIFYFANFWEHWYEKPAMLSFKKLTHLLFGTCAVKKHDHWIIFDKCHEFIFIPISIVISPCLCV